MPDQRVHPPTDQLTAFALGRLDPNQIDDVGRHVADCAECRANVKSVPQDTFVTLIRDCETVPNANRAPAHTPEQTIDLPAGSGDSAGSLPATPPDLSTLDPALSTPSSTDVESSAKTLQIDPNLVDHSRYQIIGQLGQGGMGAVYQAEHRLMQRTVALKVINQQYVSNQTAVERFHREVQAAARLQHPNIVTAYDAEQAGDTHFLVMEYVPGKDLEAVVNRKGPLPIPTACHFIRQAALGLQHAHEQGMVHRDIKPQNLMLNPRGQIKILDFGLASLAGDDAPQTALTQQGSIMGTPDYIAPEQARDTHSADIRADIYSLGCTFYRLLTGQVPFPEGKAMDKIMAHISKRPTPIQELRPQVPELLARIVQKMMAKDPAKRFQTPAEVARILTQFVTKTTPAPTQPQPSAPVEPRKPSTAQSRRAPAAQKTAPTRSPRRRWPLVTALAGAAAVLLMALAAIVIYLQGPDGSTIRIEINDPRITMSFEGKSYKFADNGKTITVTPGAKKKVYIEYDDLKFWTDDFSLGEGKDLRLRVEVKEGNLKVMVGDEMVTQRPVPAPAVAAEGGWALEFDGVDDHVKLPPFLKEPTTRELTVEAWVSLTDFTTSHKFQNLISGKWDSFVLGIQNQGPSWRCRVNNEDFVPPKKVSAKQLLHVALVMEPAEAQFYVDGRLADIKKLTKPFEPATSILYLGCWAGDQTSCLKGKLYAVRFSQSARYNGNFTPERRWKTDRATLALYRFDEGQGDTLRDSSGNGYDGAIHGAKWVRVDTPKSKSGGATDEISSAFILASEEYEWTEPVNLGPQINSKEGDGSPWVSADGLTLVFASDRPGGKGDYDIWECTRQSVDEIWSKPMNLGGAINSPGFEGGMTFSADLRTLIFAGARPGGQGKMDLWMTTRESADAPWQEAVNLGAPTNSPENDSLPFLSKDGLQLTFASNRGGRFQLFITTRRSVNDRWSNPEPFSDAGHRGGRIQLLDSGTTLLYSPNSLDIYLATWNATEKRWANDTRLPAAINDSHRNAQFCFCPSTNTLYFESDRPGGHGGTDLWMSRRVKKQTVKAKDDITLVREFEKGHPSYISSIAVSPNGQEVLSGSSWNPQDSVLLWDLATGKLKHRFAGVETPIGGVAISGDGKYAAAGGIRTLYIWDLPGRKMLHRIQAHDSIFYGVAISPDNRHVLTAGHDKTACLWDIETGKEVIRFTLPFSCQAVAFTPDGKKAMIGGSGCQLRDLANGKLIQDYPRMAFVRTLALSADGKLLATGGAKGLIRVWNLAKNQYVNELGAQTQQPSCAVRFLPDGGHVLGGCSDGTLRIWSLETGLQVAQASSEKLTFNIFALTPDGKQVVAGGGYSSGDGELKGTGDYALRLWQLPERVWPETASQSTKN